MANRNVLLPGEEQYFNAQKSNLRQNYLFGIAQNTLQRKQATTAYGQQKGDIKRAYGDERKGFAGGYVQAGRLGGGAYQRGLQELQSARDRALGRLGTDWTYQQGQFRQNSSQLAQAYYQNMGNNRQQRDALIAQLLATNRLV